MKVLSFENKNKCDFILNFAHLFVPLQPLLRDSSMEFKLLIKI